MKKTLAILLSLVLVFCAFPLGAFAAEKTYDTPASAYAPYDRYKVSSGDADYIDSLSYDQMVGVLLDWVDRQIAEATADFESFEVSALGQTIAVDIPDISSIDAIMEYAGYVTELGGDFANLDVSALTSLRRANGDINFIYGIIEFMAANSAVFGKVFHWEEGKVFDYGKVGEYIEALPLTNEDGTANTENQEIVDFYNNYLIGNDIQEKFIAEVAGEMNYEVAKDENGERTETFDEIISNGIIAWFSGICETNNILSEAGLAALRAYDLRTTDIYTLVKNFVALVQSDNQVKIDTYYNYLLDTVVRTLLKTMLGQTAVVGAEAALPEGFTATYADLALLEEISGGKAYYKDGDAYYQVTIADGAVSAVNALTWSDALDINFEPPTATILTGANTDEVVQVYRPTSKDNIVVNAYATAKNQTLIGADSGLTFAGTEVPADYAALMVDANAKALADSFGLTVAQGEEIISELAVTFKEIEAIAEQKGLEAGKAAIEETGVSSYVTLDSVDVTLTYNGWATEDEFICEVVLSDATANFTFTNDLVASLVPTDTINSMVQSAVDTYIDSDPIATIVVDGLSGNLDIDDAKALLDFIDTDFAIDEEPIAISANYDAYNGVVGQANHILYGIVDMLVSDSGMAELKLVDGGNENLTANLQKICDTANDMMAAAEEVMNDEGLQEMLAGVGIDLSAILGNLDLDLLYAIDFSSVEALYVSAISMGLDIIDDGSNTAITEIHSALDGLTNLNAMAVAVTDYALGKCVPAINEKLAAKGLELTVPAATNAASVVDGAAKDIIMTKLVDLGYEAVTWAFDDLLNGIVNDLITGAESETGADLPTVAFKFGVEKGADWEATLAAMVNRVYELADGIIIACDNTYTDTFDKISAVANAILPLGSLASNCKSENFAFDIDLVLNDYIFADALSGNFDSFLGLFETAEKTDDVAAGVPVTKALINASQHIVDSVFPGTVVADNYAASETVKEDFTSGDNDVVIASNNMKSINSRKVNLVPAALDLVRESGILPYFAACKHEGGTIEEGAVEATCVIDGISATVKCADCGYAISGGENLGKNASNHKNIVDVAKKDATCTVNGNEAGKKCNDCGTVTEGCAVIPAAHTAVRDTAAVEATCTSVGYTAGKYCDGCKTYVSGHETVAMKAHSYGAWTVTKAATCEDAGSETRTCSCGKTETRAINATGYADSDGNDACDKCGADLAEEDNSFFGRIRAFFQRIIDWFKSLFSF